jgi:SAM-dependent methyltransferase
VVATELLAFVRANLPAPPVRLLEIGAGDGALARALAEAGYDVLAIDPDPAGADVRRVALHALDEPSASFGAAVAITSLHHVEPLEDSLSRLAQLLGPGGVLVVDEFDVAAFDERAAAWWLRQRRALGAAEHASARELVGEHRAHLHPLERIVAALEPHFQVGMPLYGAYLYRWDLDESLRHHEEEAIARAEIPAVGARLLAQRIGSVA